MNMLAHFLREMLQGMDAIHPQLVSTHTNMRAVAV